LVEFLLKHKTIVYGITSVVGSILFLLSVTVHVLCIFEFNVLDSYPSVWLLHVATILVVAPFAVISSAEERREKEAITMEDTIKEPERYKKGLTSTTWNLPKWLIAIYTLLSLYLMANFIIFVFGPKGQPGIIDGKYVLQSHGHIISELDKREYDIASAQMLRGFSGHWIIFSLVAATGLFFAGKETK
jgi:Ca2+/Na+ antiporter